MFSLDKIKAKLIFAPNTTFFTTMMYSLDCQIDNSIPTACTNGIYIKFNQAFMDSCDDAKQLFVFVHEIGHVAFNHVTRCGTRDHGIWGKACDYWINHYLSTQGYSIPKDALFKEMYPSTLAVNEIYDLLLDDPEENDDPMQGDIEPTTGMDDSEVKQLEEKVMEASLRASLAAEQQDEHGNLPADFVRSLEKYLHPLVPWYVVLSNFLADIDKDDYSWRRPNRRHEDIYMPIRYSEGMGKITVYIDCSVSVTDEEYMQELSEVNTIKDCFNPAELVLVFFNQDIEAEHTFLRDEPVLIELPQSGGTSIGPVLQHIEDNPSDVAVIFTDGWFKRINIEPSTPLFWCIVNNVDFRYPFGQILNVEVECN